MPIHEPETGPSWDERAQLPGNAAVIDHADLDGVKNDLIDAVHKLALRRGMGAVRGRRVLDVGCGNGRISRWLAARGALVTGVDPSAEMLRVARGLASEIEYVQGEAEALPGASESYDLAVAVTVLQYLAPRPDSLAAASAEIGRVLRPGGRFVAIEHVHDGGLDRGGSVAVYADCFRGAGLGLRHAAPVRLGRSRLLARLTAHPQLANRPLAAGALMLEARIGARRPAAGDYAEFVFVCDRSET